MRIGIDAKSRVPPHRRGGNAVSIGVVALVSQILLGYKFSMNVLLRLGRTVSLALFLCLGGCRIGRTRVVLSSGPNVQSYWIGLALAILLTIASFAAAVALGVWAPSLPVLLAVLAIAQMGETPTCCRWTN